MPDYSKHLKELKQQIRATPLKGNQRLVTCKHCTYPWICDSVLATVSCPSCMGKTPSNLDDIGKPVENKS